MLANDNAQSTATWFFKDTSGSHQPPRSITFLSLIPYVSWNAKCYQLFLTKNLTNLFDLSILLLLTQSGFSSVSILESLLASLPPPLLLLHSLVHAPLT